MIRQDLRYGLRWLRANPGFTTSALVVLALGIGATTATFCVVHSVALRPLPLADPGRLVRIWSNQIQGNVPFFSVSPPDFEDWRGHTRTLSHVAAYVGQRALALKVDSDREVVQASDVSGDLFPLLGVRPLHGRWIGLSESRPGGAHGAVIAYGLWQRLGARPDIVGSPLKVRGVTGVVVGVARLGEQWPVEAELWTARRTPFDEGDLSPNNYIYQSIARLKPSSGPAAVRQRLDLLARDAERERTQPVLERVLGGLVLHHQPPALEHPVEQARLGGDAAARKRHQARGKLLPRERLAALANPALAVCVSRRRQVRFFASSSSNTAHLSATTDVSHRRRSASLALRLAPRLASLRVARQLEGPRRRHREVDSGMTHSQPFARWACITALALVLAACGEESEEAVAANQAPTISGTPGTSVNQGTAYSFTPSAADADGDALLFGIDAKPAWAVFDSATGRLSGMPGQADVGTHRGIVIHVSDGKAQAMLPAFDLTVVASPANRAPVISGTPATTVVAGSAYAFQPTASDADGNTLTFSIASRPSWATFDTATGRLAGTPATAGTFGNIVISVSDGVASASLPTFAITVTAPPPVNRPPTISGTPPTTATVGAAYAFTPTASDPDGNTLTFAITNRPSWATFNANTGALQGTPPSAQTNGNIVISVSDGSASASLAAFSITVTATNSPPTISGTPPTTATVGTAFTFTPTASDPDGGTLTFSITNRPSWATFTAATGRLQGTPASADVGTFANIVISVSDGSASASLPAFSITVSEPPNRAPTITGTPPTAVLQGTAYTFTPTAADPDGDTLTFSIANQPAWAAFDTATGRLSGTPGAGDVGTTSGIVISVSDGSLSASLAAFALTEPDAGSDLGAIQTQALKVEGGWVLNGAKTWITNARHADPLPVLVKTYPDATPAHRGMSILLVEQEVTLAFEVCPRACVLEAGRVVASGSSEQLASSETVSVRASSLVWSEWYHRAPNGTWTPVLPRSGWGRRGWAAPVPKTAEFQSVPIFWPTPLAPT